MNIVGFDTAQARYDAMEPPDDTCICENNPCTCEQDACDARDDYLIDRADAYRKGEIYP